MLCFQNDFVYSHEILYAYDKDFKIAAVAYNDGSIRFSAGELSMADLDELINKVKMWRDE